MPQPADGIALLFVLRPPRHGLYSGSQRCHHNIRAPPSKYLPEKASASFKGVLAASSRWSGALEPSGELHACACGITGANWKQAWIHAVPCILLAITKTWMIVKISYVQKRFSTTLSEKDAGAEYMSSLPSRMGFQFPPANRCQGMLMHTKPSMNRRRILLRGMGVRLDHIHRCSAVCSAGFGNVPSEGQAPCCVA